MTVGKSALWLTLTSILCLSCCTALAGKGNWTGPVWKDIGGSITIQCKTTMQDPISMSLKWGLHEQVEILSAEKSAQHITIREDLKHRVKAKRNYPMLDIVIRNLTVEDTGAYWCLYKQLDSEYNVKQEKGDGSVLLVVKGAALTCSSQGSTPEEQGSSEKTPSTLVLLCVLTAGIVLLVIFVLLFIWIIFKIKAIHSTPKPRRVNTNDVYEDMRGTIRR